MQSTLPEPVLGDRCRQHPLFHGERGRSGDLERGGGGRKTAEDPKAVPIPPLCPNPKLPVCTKPQRDREKWGRGERDGGGKSKKIAKVNGLELEAASATAV